MAVDLREMVKAAKPSIAVIGLGGAGCNIVTWIAQKGMAGGRIIAANTDINHLASMSKADKLILLGKRLCKGYGCGGYPEMGAEATRENLPEIRADLQDVDLLFLVAGLGGGTGSGAIPVIAGVARELGILTIACVTIPFKMETARREKAREAIKVLTESCDSTIVIDNSKLSEFAGDLPLKDALTVANALVGGFVRNITETITQPSLVNLDYADLRTVMERRGIGAIGIGEGDGEDRITRAVSRALAVPLLDTPGISAAYGVLIHIAGGEDMTLEEVAAAGERIVDKVPDTRRVIWGARVDSSLTGKVCIMAVLTGIKSPFIEGK
ncbi:MAG: cell division protein FtsZ [Candidatus Methanoperedens sp.]|nr:MAG: cell division protein FtsZ [Candidatus Methanoperedens sp.]